jgi:hypothetical protein
VQGYAAIPTDVNSLTFDSGFDVGTAGVQFPRLQRFYVAVDSRADAFTNRSQKGRYVLKAWVDDLVGPAVRILTTRVTAGRPLIAAVAVDPQSGVDPLSLVINYKNALVGASAYDPTSGLILFGIPPAAPAFKAGKTNLVLQASDYQETKNINTVGDAILPNSTFAQKKITVVAGPTVSWVAPAPNVCAAKKEQLVVIGGAVKKISQVAFTLDGKRIGIDKSGPLGLYSLAWKTAKAAKGNHLLVATLTDASGTTAASARRIKICH